MWLKDLDDSMEPEQWAAILERGGEHFRPGFSRGSQALGSADRPLDSLWEKQMSKAIVS